MTTTLDAEEVLIRDETMCIESGEVYQTSCRV